MNEYFDLDEQLIVLRVMVYGPTGFTIAALALDTGSTQTMIDPLVLTGIGYDLSQPFDTFELVTASGVVTVPTITLDRLEAFGEAQDSFPVTVHSLPEGSIVQGLLGLAFSRGRVLTIDFARGEIELT